MASIRITGFTYQAESRTLPKRKCTACGRRGGIVETVAATNGGPPVQTIECRTCGSSVAKELPR